MVSGTGAPEKHQKKHAEQRKSFILEQRRKHTKNEEKRTLIHLDSVLGQDKKHENVQTKKGHGKKMGAKGVFSQHSQSWALWTRFQWCSILLWGITSSWSSQLSKIYYFYLPKKIFFAFNLRQDWLLGMKRQIFFFLISRGRNSDILKDMIYDSIHASISFIFIFNIIAILKHKKDKKTKTKLYTPGQAGIT